MPLGYNSRETCVILSLKVIEYFFFFFLFSETTSFAADTEKTTEKDSPKRKKQNFQKLKMKTGLGNNSAVKSIGQSLAKIGDDLNKKYATSNSNIKRPNGTTTRSSSSTGFLGKSKYSKGPTL